MLLYIAFVAALNLCVGYVLGVHIGHMPGLGLSKLGLSKLGLPRLGLPRLSFGKREIDSDDAEPLVQPVADETPQGTQGVSSNDIESGLAAFQQQLAEMSTKLGDSQDDSQAFGDCARDMQAANHAYLESAQEQIDGLDAGDACREAAESGTDQVGKISEEFDSIIENGLEGEEARASLLEKTCELSEKVATAKDVLTEAAEQAEDSAGNQGDDRTAATDTPSDSDPDAESNTDAESESASETDVIATLDRLLEQIEDALQEDDSTRCRVAALIRTDNPDVGSGEVPKWFNNVKGKIPELVGEALNNPDLVETAGSDQCVALLDERDLDSVVRQIETLRMEIAQTTFAKGDEKLSTTVTCAVVDLPGTETTEEVLRRMNEALDEAQSQGPNKTYHHDGRFPTQVEVEVEPVESRSLKL